MHVWDRTRWRGMNTKSWEIDYMYKAYSLSDVVVTVMQKCVRLTHSCQAINYYDRSNLILFSELAQPQKKFVFHYFAEV